MFFNQRVVRRFTRQLTMLLEEDVPFPQALELIALQQRSKRWKNRILDVRQRVKHGESIPKAFSHHKVFGAGYHATLAWAESTNSADDLLVALRLLSDDTTSRFPRQLDKGKENRQPLY